MQDILIDVILKDFVFDPDMGSIKMVYRNCTEFLLQLDEKHIHT